MRKKIPLVILAIIITLSPSVIAQQYGWLDLFVDFDYPSTIEYCVYPAPGVPDQSFNCYVLARPPQGGFVSTECKIVLPPDPALSIGNIVYPQNMILADGDWLTRMVLYFNQCMTEDWVLCATIEMQIGEPGLQPGCRVIQMYPADGTNFFGFRACAQVSAEHQVDIYINCSPCPSVHTEPLSWGAIKGLFE